MWYLLLIHVWGQRCSSVDRVVRHPPRVDPRVTLQHCQTRHEEGEAADWKLSSLAVLGIQDQLGLGYMKPCLKNTQSICFHKSRSCRVWTCDPHTAYWGRRIKFKTKVIMRPCRATMLMGLCAFCGICCSWDLVYVRPPLPFGCVQSCTVHTTQIRSLQA